MPVENNNKLLDQLSICSVSYISNDLLNSNLKTTLRLNKIDSIRWIVVNNNVDKEIEQPSLSSNFKVIKGESNSYASNVRGSYHHAQGLNMAVKYVSTRFLLVLDPDFFIIRPDWIEVALNHMIKHNISILGAPNYPSHINKPRYFPCAICMFIDLEKVHINDLDFTPEIYEYMLIEKVSDADLFYLLLGLPTSLPDKLNNINGTKLLDMVFTTLRNRHINIKLRKNLLRNPHINRHLHKALEYYGSKNINISRDTGCKIYKKYHLSLWHKNECLTPAFINPLYCGKTGIRGLLYSMFYHLIPESLSKYPLRRKYTVTNFFRDFNLPDINNLGWEEYFWQMLPFGFHVKGASSKDISRLDFNMAQLLDRF